MGKRKAVFLDRDGTINIDKNYVFRKEDFGFLPGALEGMKRLKEAGYLLIILTNQSGIARGYYTEEQYLSLQAWMCRKMKQENAEPDGIYYCPHLPDASIIKYRKICCCRKPNLGMFYQAIRDYDIDITASAAVGDKKRDLCICIKEHIPGYLIYSQDASEQESPFIHCLHGGLLEAANQIISYSEKGK